MHLYLRNADFATEVPGIGLQNGCIPVIGTQKLFTPDNEALLQIEPAVWFKVQVIDAVSIDCTKRAILWNSETVFNNELNNVYGTSSDSERSENDSSEKKKEQEADPDKSNEVTGEPFSNISQGIHESSANISEIDKGTGTDKTPKNSSFSSSNKEKVVKRKKSGHGLKGRKRISESMYIGGECYGYQSDLDELFDTAQKLLSDYAVGMISSKEMNETVFKLLHCYILPAIKLTSDDLAKVIAAYKSQEDAVEDADREILQKNKEIEQLQHAMCVQRQKHFIPDLCSGMQGSLPAYDLDFAKTLQKQIDSDISRAWDYLDVLQNAVEEAKGAGNPNPNPKGAGNDSKSNLELRRKQRDAHHEKYENLLRARETLRDVIEKVEIRKRKSVQASKSLRAKAKKTFKKGACVPHIDALLSVYIGMDQEVQNRLEDLQALADKKVLVISVKEAMRMTIKELQRGDDTFGIDVDKTGRIKATDVLRHSNIPKQWQTLTEQVGSIISNTDHRLGQEHLKFCEQVRQQCDALDHEEKLLNSCKPIIMESEFNNMCMEAVIEGSILSSVSSSNGSDLLQDSASSKNSALSSASASVQSTYSAVSAATSDLSVSDFSVIDKISPHPSVCDTLPPESRVLGCIPLPFHRHSKPMHDSESSRSNCIKDDRRDSIIQLESRKDSVYSDNELSDTPDGFIVVHDTEQDYSRKIITQLKENIHAHFQRICESLQKELNYVDQAYYRKIWLCYETMFYEELMPHLVKLYEGAFSSLSNTLQESLRLLTVEELDIAGSIVMRMLRNRPASLDTTLEEQDVKTVQLNPVRNAGSLPVIPSPTSLESPSATQQKDTTAKLGNQLESIPENNSSCLVTTCKAGKEADFTSIEIPEIPRKMSEPTVDLPKLKTIKIHHPSVVTMIYDRRTWPMPQKVLAFTESIDCGIEALQLDAEEMGESGTTSPNSPRSPLCSPGPKVIVFTPEFREKFSVAFESLEGAVTAVSPLLKLQHLTRCLREISQQVTMFHHQFLTSSSIGACSDELIDILVVLLCNCDTELVTKIYPHIMLLTNLMPPFFEGGPYCFSLVQFSVAFQFLQERLLMKRRKS